MAGLAGAERTTGKSSDGPRQDERVISRSSIELKDGSVLRTEVEFNNDRMWVGTLRRLTYYHDDKPISFEGMKYLRNTLGKDCS
jgi:hypothetical protein